MTIHVDDDDNSQDDEGVGYKKTPTHSRFKPGQSGNPKGRSKGIELPVFEDPIKTMLREEISITLKGKRRKVPTFQALLRVVLGKALGGDIRFIKLLLTETDNLKSILDEKRREMNGAEKAFLEEMLKECDRWGVDAKKPDQGKDVELPQ
jgi:Family of unknown function (DUF5681)